MNLGELKREDRIFDAKKEPQAGRGLRFFSKGVLKEVCYRVSAFPIDIIRKPSI